MAVREINQARQALASGKAAFSPELRAALQAARPQAATVCDVEDGPSTLDTTNFHIVYGTINTLTAQQYGDALEETFAKEITGYGWAKPPLSDNNSFGRYPVQISDIGDQTYGYVTTSGGNYTSVVGDNPNTPAVETAALASLHGDQQRYTTICQQRPASWAASLKVTMGHEYFHSVQYGYGDPARRRAGGVV